MVDYADYVVLLTNTPAQAESPLHCWRQAVEGIGLYVNTNKIKFMCLKQQGAISTLSVKPIKFDDR